MVFTNNKKGQAVAIGIIAVVLVVALVIIFTSTGGEDTSSENKQQAPDTQSGQEGSTESGTDSVSKGTTSDSGTSSTSDTSLGSGTPAVEVVSASADKTIELTNYEFSNDAPSISPGTVVEFKNSEGSHTVTLDAQGIDKTLSGSQSVTLKFNEKGTYQIYCKFHGSPGSGMHSDVSVGSTSSGTSDTSSDSGNGYSY
ncbi:MAG: hypothetical protein ABEI74_01255 [Candidatus Pacearchaeota archaeon]